MLTALDERNAEESVSRTFKNENWVMKHDAFMTLKLVRRAYLLGNNIKNSCLYIDSSNFYLVKQWPLKTVKSS